MFSRLVGTRHTFTPITINNSISRIYHPNISRWSIPTQTSISPVLATPIRLISSIQNSNSAISHRRIQATILSSLHPKTPHRPPPPTTQSRRRSSNRRRRDNDDEDLEDENGSIMPPRGGKGEHQQTRRPDQVEAETHRNTSRNLLPEHMRGTSGFVFRKGLSVPKLNPNHWINTFVLEPWIAFKGNNLVWWDTQVRFTKLGFLTLHFVSILAAGIIGWYAPKYFWIDYEDNMERSRHLYMIDVARLLWLQTAINRCELVIQQRVNGVIPGLLLDEALQSERESPFKSALFRQQHDISDRLKQWKDEEEREEKRKKQLRHAIWGDSSPGELDELKLRQKRQEELKRSKIGARPQYDAELFQTRDEIKTELNQQKGGFRDQYINSRLKVEG